MKGNCEIGYLLGHRYMHGCMSSTYFRENRAIGEIRKRISVRGFGDRISHNNNLRCHDSRIRKRASTI